MKKVEAVIKPEKLQETLNSLIGVDVWGVTVTMVRGCGRQKGYLTGNYLSKEKPVQTLPFVKLEFVVKDEVVETLIDVIRKVNSTGEVGKGNGKIFVYPVLDAVRISTGERGEDAIGGPK